MYQKMNKRQNEKGDKMNEKKWCLLKVSDGNRGLNGKKKIYEVVVVENKVSMSWGMAEKAQRQNKVVTTYSNQSALSIAQEKVAEKLNGGYVLAYVV